MRGTPGGSSTSEKKETIDFMFSSLKTLVPRQVLEVPEEEVLGPGRLPSIVFPSDHMSLVAKFVMV